MSAVRVARAATGRDRILKFEGCYHGHADAFLVKAGSGALTLGTPTSPGVTRAASADTLVAAYNDLESVQQAVRRPSRSDRRGHRRADRRQHGGRAAGRRLPSGTARDLHGRGRAADLRRGDLRISRVVRRRAGDRRRSSGSDLPRQDHRRRTAGRRLRRPRRSDEPRLAGRSGLSGGNAVGQPARDDRGAVVPRTADADALHLARRAGRAPRGRPGRRRARRRRGAAGQRVRLACSRRSSPIGPCATTRRRPARTRITTPHSSAACSRAASIRRRHSSRRGFSRRRTPRRTWTRRSARREAAMEDVKKSSVASRQSPV